MTLRVLILGGTSEASALCKLIAEDGVMNAILSLAGRTKTPAAQPIPARIGGFGGVDGLATYLRNEHIDIVVDASHPFAEQISFNAEEACKRVALPLLVLTRPPWQWVEGDLWQEVSDLDEAARALGDAPRRVLLTSGRKGLKAFEAATQHDYLIRTIEEPEPLVLLHARFLQERGPFDEASERALMQNERIEILVTKNSGGDATYAKILAARALCLPVVIVRPPQRAGLLLHDPVEVMTRLREHHAKSLIARGV